MSSICHSARNWWLRSPNWNNANNERNVNTNGNANNNNATNSNGVVPDCGESPIQVGVPPEWKTPKAVHPRRERITCLDKKREYTGRRRQLLTELFRLSAPGT